MALADKNNYKKRIADKAVEKYLATFGAVCIEGPKWCGKTWLASFHSKSEFLVGDPADNFQNRALAEMSPSVVLEGATPRLIDEWQEVPPIWDAVRYAVDIRADKGQFLLTGSSTPKRKGILHSGAGRIGKLKMRTMSLYETMDSSGAVSLRELCDGVFPTVMTGEQSLKNLAKYVVRGGFPGNLSTPEENISLLPASYLDAILDDDAHRIDGKAYDKSKMRLLLKSLARNESTTATNSKLLNDIKEMDDRSVDGNTLATYLDVFNRLFLLDNQPPFALGARSATRLKQAEKRHFCDPSLACAVLKLTPEKLIDDLQTFGFMFEALCEHDLKVYAESFGASLFHYQDYAGREVDAVVETPDGRWCAFEIKLGANQIDKAAEGLVALKKAIEKGGGTPPSVLCVICGLASAAYLRKDGVYVVPITALKD